MPLASGRKSWYSRYAARKRAAYLYPGIAKLVSRLVWECRGCIRDRVRRNTAKPCDTCICGISTDCRKRYKIGFDHINDHRQKIFDFPPRCGIITEIEYPGIAKLVSRLVWDQETVRSSRTTRTKIPLKSTISEEFFLFFVYCGAESESAILNIPFLQFLCKV